MTEHVRIAVVQEGPAYLDKAASLAKAVDLIDRACEQAADLIVFGETWLSGYPIWIDVCPEVNLWDHSPVKKVFARTYQNGVRIDGKEIETLRKKAKEKRVALCMGMNEVIETGPGNGTIYNSFIIIDRQGNIVQHHRKLMPTYTERLVYGLGDGHGLSAVDLGFARVGALICWEHWMPLSRQAMHNSNEHIHLALWPQVKEMNQVASRQYAFEGRCFVVAAGQYMTAGEIPKELNLPAQLAENPDQPVMNGGTCAFGPDGSVIVAPQEGRGGIVMVELGPMSQVIEERMNLDTTGHYQRSDVFDFSVDRKRR